MYACLLSVRCVSCCWLLTLSSPSPCLSLSLSFAVARLMNDAVRQQNLYLSYAVWENALAAKDVAAGQKRASAIGAEDSQLTSKSVRDK